MVEQVIRPTGLLGPGHRGTAQPQPDRRPAGRDTVAHRARRSGCWSPRSPNAWAEELNSYLAKLDISCNYIHSGRRHPRPHQDSRRPAGRGLRRAHRGQPAARGTRPARGIAGGYPRCRQGGIPALAPVAHPDGGTGRAQPQRTSHHVCRPHYREHAKDHRRDQPPTREAVGLQRGAPHHPQGHTEGQEFDTRCHRPRPSRNPNRPSRRKGRKPAPAARAYSDE